MVFRMEKMRKPAINSISFVEAWLRLLHAVWQRGFGFFVQFGSVDHFDAGHHKPWHGAVGGSRIRGARVVQPDVSDVFELCCFVTTSRWKVSLPTCLTHRLLLA